MNDLIEMWDAHRAIPLYLLANLPNGGLDAVILSDSSTVAQAFAHMNDVRIRWASEAAPDLTANLAWFERQPERALDARSLQRALEESGAAVRTIIVDDSALVGSGVKDFPGGSASFLGYLVAHEFYHIGEIGLALTQSGKPLDPDVALGIWKGWWGREVS